MGQLFLVESHNPQEIKSFSIEDKAITLGRSRRCSIQLLDEKVSGEHLLLEINGLGQIVFKDLNSSNGTFLNGKKVQDGVIKSYDILIIGNLKISLQEIKRPINEAPVEVLKTSVMKEEPSLSLNSFEEEPSLSLNSMDESLSHEALKIYQSDEITSESSEEKSQLMEGFERSYGLSPQERDASLFISPNFEEASHIQQIKNEDEEEEEEDNVVPFKNKKSPTKI